MLSFCPILCLKPDALSTSPGLKEFYPLFLASSLLAIFSSFQSLNVLPFIARFRNINAISHRPNPIMTGNTSQNRSTIRASPKMNRHTAIPP